MSAEAAIKLGHRVCFLGSDPDGPCAGLGRFVRGDIFSELDVEAFSKDCDVLTLENEFIPLNVLEKAKDKLFPSLDSFARIENKIIEKESAISCALPVGSYETYESISDVKFAPGMLKLAKGGYDGYGNFMLQGPEDLVSLKQKGLQGKLILEKFIPFEREVAVTIGRSTTGEHVLYPVVDTIQKNNMCSRVLAPSTLDESAQDKIRNLSLAFAEEIGYVGVMSLEFFALENGEVFFNECSPRPHNSGHYTMDACETSQFENHIRAITGMPLGSAEMRAKNAVMLNILGRESAPAKACGMEAFPMAKFHLYNKTMSRPGRKMGHANLIGNNREELLKLSDEIEREVSI